MYDLQLRKGGKLFVKVWNAKNNEYSESEVGYDSLSIHFNDFICFESGVKLIDIFSLFQRDVELFAVATGCSYISDLIGEIKSSIKSNVNGLGGIVVSWLASKENGDYIDISPMVYGSGLNKDFDVGSIPLEEISLLPVILDTTFELVDRENNSVLVQSSKPFTLLDVSKALVDELGSLPPSVRDYVEFSIFPPEASFQPSVEAESVKCKKCGKGSHSYMFQKPKDICEECFKKVKEN